jgi:hypothetical protein
LPNIPLTQNKLGQLGLRPGPSPVSTVSGFFYGWIKLSCTGWARLQLGQTPAGLAWSLAQAGGQQALMHELFTHALHRVKVMITTFAHVK